MEQNKTLIVALNFEMSSSARARAWLSNPHSTKVPNVGNNWNTVVYIEIAITYEMSRVDERDLSQMV